MKNRFFYLMLFIGALSMTLASCNEDILPDNGEGNEGKGVRTVKLGVQIESGTKVTLSNDATPAFAWEVGDKIGVWVGTSSSDAGGGFQEFTVSEEGEKKLISGNITDGKNRFNYAVFPSGIFSYSGGSLTVTLPHTYALSEVRGENGTKTPLPMVAVNDNANNYLTFYNVGGMLRLTVKSIPADATGLDIQFPGNKVNGTFTVSIPDDMGPENGPTISTAVPALSSGQDKITITGLPTDKAEPYDVTVNIPLPTGAYEDVYITPVGSTTKVAAVRHINGASYTAQRAHGKMLTTTLVSFSVSASKKVIFAPGNLQATTADQGGDWTWHFAANQYNAIKNNAANTTISGKGTVSTNGTVDLFGYSTDNNLNFYGIFISKRDNYYPDSPTKGNFKDWGTNIIGKYPTNYWYTMAKSEWEYLLNSRTTPLFAKVSVNGVYGLLLFPDNFIWDTTTMGNVPSTVDNKSGNYNATDCSISSNNWNNLEAAGVVFLPAGGYRSQGANTVSNLSPARGYYWFSDTNGTQSGSGTTYENNSTYHLYFGQSNIWSTTNTLTKRCGASVRLVREIITVAN